MPRVVVVFATLVLLCSRVEAQIGPLGHSEWGGLVPTTSYTTLQQWNNAFNKYNVACGASNCSSSVAAQKVAEGWSTSTIPVNATQMEINNWMRMSPCLRNPELVYGKLGVDLPCQEKTDINIYMALWKLIGVSDRDSTVTAVVDAIVSWYDPLVPIALSLGGDSTKFWAPRVYFPDAISVKKFDELTEAYPLRNEMIGSLGHNRMVNDRFLVVFSNRGQWNVFDYPFDKRTLRLVMSIKDGHPMQQQYKFTFTAFSPSYLYSSYNRNFDFFIKGLTLQKQIGKAWTLTKEAPDQLFSCGAADMTLDAGILANPAATYVPLAREVVVANSGFGAYSFWRNVTITHPTMGAGHVMLIHVKRNPTQWIANSLLPMIFCVVVTYSSAYIPKKMTMPRIATTALSLIAAINLIRGIQQGLPVSDELTAAELVFFGLLTNVVFMTVGHCILFYLGDASLEITPAQLAVYKDTEKSVELAMRLGMVIDTAGTMVSGFAMTGQQSGRIAVLVTILVLSWGVLPIVHYVYLQHERAAGSNSPTVHPDDIRSTDKAVEVDEDAAGTGGRRETAVEPFAYKDQAEAQAGP